MVCDLSSLPITTGEMFWLFRKLSLAQDHDCKVPSETLTVQQFSEILAGGTSKPRTLMVVLYKALLSLARGHNYCVLSENRTHKQ